MAHPDRAPALSHEHFCTMLVHVARAYELPVGFFANLIWQESKFDHRVVSRAGAQGVAQFMPQVARMFRLENPFDAREALPASGRLLQSLLQQFGNLGLAAAAYNAGPRRVIAWRANRGQLPKETRDYVQIITGRPATDWKGVARTAAFRVPERVPCHQVEFFAQVEQAERAHLQARAGGELRIVPQADTRQADTKQENVTVAVVAERARKTKRTAGLRQARRIEAGAIRKRPAQLTRGRVAKQATRGRAVKLAELKGSSRTYSAPPQRTRNRAARRS